MNSIKSPPEVPGEGESNNPVYPNSGDTTIRRLEARTESAEARTERAKARTEQAEMRTEQAESRTEHAKTRTEQAETRTEEAETRSEQAEARTEEATLHSEEAIRLSELRYRRLFEAAKDGILLLEGETGRIADVNPFLIQLLGFSRGELLGKTLNEISPFKNLEFRDTLLERLQKQDHVRLDDLALETKDGNIIAVEFVSSLYQAGEGNVIQCSVRDITERKGAVEQIRVLNAELERRVVERTEQLQSANEELEAFSHSVSHDLRAPLRHIIGFAEMLQKGVGSSLSEKNLLYLTTISQSAARMRNLITDLLAFSRLGQEELRKTNFKLAELVNETVRDFEAETKKRNISWKIDPLPMVWADRSLLRMVLVNLLSNAVKFTTAQAKPKIEIGCTAGEKETVIFIRDNGAGFDPRYAGKLFGVFQRLHTNEQFEGTGIGLANIHRIIQRHGGRAWAEGAVDAGATFYFSLPKQNMGLGDLPIKCPPVNSWKYKNGARNGVPLITPEALH